MDQKEKVDDLLQKKIPVWAQLKDQQSVSTYNLSNTFEKDYTPKLTSNNALKKYNEITRVLVIAVTQVRCLILNLTTIPKSLPSGDQIKNGRRSVFYPCRFFSISNL